MKSFIYLIKTSLLCGVLNFSLINAYTSSHISGIEIYPLIFSKSTNEENSYLNSVHELLMQADLSITVITSGLFDLRDMQIINQMAERGTTVQIVTTKDHADYLEPLTHPKVQLLAREAIEGNLDHNIVIVDHQYVWLGSGTLGIKNVIGQPVKRNLGIGFYSPAIAAKLSQEALDIATGNLRDSKALPISESYGDQLLELYALPHTPP